MFVPFSKKEGENTYVRLREGLMVNLNKFK